MNSPLPAAEPGLVVMTCGLPGSGKSSYSQELERLGFRRLSMDEVIWRRIGVDAATLPPAEYEELKADAERDLWSELVTLLRDRRPVVLDYSFWSRANRKRYQELIESYGCRWELVHLKADLETLRRRLAIRNTLDDANSVTVSDELLQRYFASFEEPVGEGERVIPQV